MKVTTCINLRRCSILAILFLLSTAVLTAQIKIKERVEIAPTNTKRLKARTSSSYQPGTLLIDSDVQGLIYNNMMTYYFGVNGVFFGSSIPVGRVSELLPTQTMFDFGRFSAGTFITPSIRHFTTYTNGAPDVDLIQEPRATESITFTVNTKTGQYEPGYIIMSIQELLHHIDGTFSSGEIGAGEGAVLSLSPIAADGTPVEMVGDVEIGVSTDAGIQFVNPDRVDESGSSYLWRNAINGINVIGNEIYGSGDYNYGNVYIWNGSTDVTSSTAIGVQTELLCPEPKVSKDTIGTGETVSINIIGHNKYGQIASFPDWQIYNIWITKGEQYGNLISPWGANGSIVMGPQPFKFRADDSIDMDTVVVQIRVQPLYGGGGAGSIGVVTKDTLRSHAPLIMSKQTNTNNIAAVPTETNSKSIEQTINSLQDQLKKESKKKGREKQQEKLAISIEQLKAQLAYKTAINSSEKQTALASMKHLAMLATEATECKTTADVTIVNKPKLIIIDHSPWTLWPYLPPQVTKNRGVESRGADLPGYNPKRPFRVQLQDPSGNPIANRNIKLKITFTLQSGGHQHSCSNANVELPLYEQGVFTNKGKILNNPVVITTDNNGFAPVDSFRASQFSGQYLITASLASDTTVYDTVHIRVMIPGLGNFTEHAAYEHDWTFSQSDPCYEINHQSPNWFNANATDSLTCVAFAWNDWCNQNGFEEYAILSLNDMSLEWGGAFDFPGLWNFNDYHSFHRVGCSVDINGTDWYFKDEKKIILSYLGEQLKLIMDYFGGKPYPERMSIHYGFIGQK